MVIRKSMPTDRRRLKMPVRVVHRAFRREARRIAKAGVEATTGTTARKEMVRNAGLPVDNWSDHPALCLDVSRDILGRRPVSGCTRNRAW